MPANVVLINPPWFFREKIEFFSQNLAIGYLAGYLEKRGHRVTVIDALAEGEDRLKDVETRWGRVIRAGLSCSQTVDLIPGRADIVGITAPFTHHGPIVRELARRIKEALPSALTVMGGVYPSTLPERALAPGVDCIVKGEGEAALAALAEGADPRGVKGVWLREKDGTITGSGTGELIDNLDDIPFPARHLMPMEKYLRLSGRGRAAGRAAAVITSRGCPFNCTFCSVHAVYGRKWRARSPENVIRELQELRDRFGVEHIEFEDDNLTLNTGRAEAIFDSMAGMGLSWSCSNGIRIDRLNTRLLDRIKQSGCRVLNLGIEHGDPEMLRLMNKKLDLAKVEEVVSECLERNIPTVGFWVICHPGETEQRFENGLEFFKKLKRRGMYGVGVHPAWPMPGTRLFEMCRENGWLARDDIEESLIFPGPFYIECPEFDAAEAKRRLERARAELGEDNYLRPKNSLAEEILAGWARVLAGSRIIKTGPVRLGDNYTSGFYPTEAGPGGKKFRWSKPRATVNITPASPRAKMLHASLESIEDKPLTVKANGSVVHECRLEPGLNRLCIKLGNSRPENRILELEFITEPTVPAEISGDSKDLRDLGVIIRWLRLL